jgi:hypothetical protein
MLSFSLVIGARRWMFTGRVVSILLPQTVGLMFSQCSVPDRTEAEHKYRE